ncbi:helix-turn-helix transcriptional regulator [Acetoanaerobium sticklandii]|uniref:helix-turn-helix transcriptional regulator n=1 Tax=Acetoanaerobium sticklandii TaxID=1511 RepID=UPI003A8D36DF
MDKNTALDFLSRLCDGLSVMFGPNCETVVHDMNDPNKSIVYIFNGQVTNRNIGDKFKILGGKDIDKFFSGTDIINCKALSPDKRTLKSSTFHMKGHGYHYALGINFDYTNFEFAHNILKDLISVGKDISEVIQASPNTEDLLDGYIDDALKFVGKPISMLKKEDRVQIVKCLEEKGAFVLQRSIPIISERLNISRYTLYNYLKEIRN